MATPLMIEIALHYHCSAGDFDPQRIEAPAVKEALTEFVLAGLLRAGSDRQYEPTVGLSLYVEHLCAVPWPVRRWVMPEQEAA